MLDAAKTVIYDSSNSRERSMNKLIIPVAALIVMTGCIPPLRPMTTPFRSEDFTKYAGDGSGTVTGQAFLKTRGGDVKFGAGCDVELCPVTPYIQERISRETLGGERLEYLDPRVVNYTRHTTADGSGSFEFKRLPPGKWVAYCEITWMVPAPYGGTKTGGLAIAVFDVKDNETTKVVVTR